MPRILVPNPKACQVCLHCLLGFSYPISVHMLCILRNYICFIPIFSLVVLRKNFCRYLMGMTEKASRAVAFLSW
jgi:hypothetical protein